MAWFRLASEQSRLVNLDGFVHLEVAVSGERDDLWAVNGLRSDGSSDRLFEGSQLACDAILDQLAEAVWAAEVGVAGPAATKGPRPGDAGPVRSGPPGGAAAA